MESRAKFLGHSIHQMLIVFPLGLLGTAVVFDVIYLIGENGTMAVVAFWMIVSGIIGGLIAAPFGLVDLAAVPRGTRAQTIGIFHAAGNLLALGLFALSGVLRLDEPASPELIHHLLAFGGLGFALVGGWLGGELVSRLGVGVDEGANLNSPSSLRDEPAYANEKRVANL